MLVKAVLFDFDNTLVDSASVHPLAQRRVAELITAYLNGSVGFEKVFTTVRWCEFVVELQGVYDRDRIWEHVLHELGYGGSAEPKVLRSWTQAYWEEYCKGKPYPETVTVLEKLHGRYGLGLVTNTDGLAGMKTLRLKASGLENFFEAVVVAGEDVAEKKPSPVPFLHAAKLLNVKPNECLMIGDDPVNDVVGAKAAGMKAALLDPTRSKKSPIKPDVIITNLTQILSI